MDQLTKKRPTHQVNGIVGGRDISIEAGRLARQANGSILLRSGDTVLLATATMSKKPKDGVDFLPLTVRRTVGRAFCLRPLLVAMGKDKTGSVASRYKGTLDAMSCMQTSKLT